ncbi:hypothetical protein KC19_3G218400 [Ceratodon purpureus]|uniref:Peptidase C14 caspase domain-containing protein n=1 Tax=Ceratodon purpureus TaxID=3225 RepID=A0A8T0INZ8_CERPU|nr:hypothetical protein KC19_3G218400 [Ceratodon purpureus]
MVKKKALLVGCNYPGQAGTELKGCCNDARRLCTLLKTRFGFPGENIDVLVDDNPGTDQSTHANIRKYLEKLVGDVQSGDILVFSFSGHGNLLERSNDNTGWNEAIFPNDLTNPLTDDDFRAIVNQIPAGVTFTFISDSCCSGGLIDELKEQVGGAEGGKNFIKQSETYDPGSRRMTLPMLIKQLNNRGCLNGAVNPQNFPQAIFQLHKGNASLTITSRQPIKSHKKDDVGILLSGCESWEISIDEKGDNPPATAYGVFTKAIETVVSRSSKALSNKEMTNAVRRLIQSDWDRTAPHLDDDGKEVVGPQHPCLYCSDGNADKVFICDFV